MKRLTFPSLLASRKLTSSTLIALFKLFWLFVSVSVPFAPWTAAASSSSSSGQAVVMATFFSWAGDWSPDPPAEGDGGSGPPINTVWTRGQKTGLFLCLPVNSAELKFTVTEPDLVSVLGRGGGGIGVGGSLDHRDVQGGWGGRGGFQQVAPPLQHRRGQPLGDDLHLVIWREVRPHQLWGRGLGGTLDPPQDHTWTRYLILFVCTSRLLTDPLKTRRRLTCVYAHKRAAVQVVTATNTPAAALCLEDLEADPDPSLDQPVLTASPLATTPGTTLIHTENTHTFITPCGQKYVDSWTTRGSLSSLVVTFVCLFVCWFSAQTHITELSHNIDSFMLIV